MSDEFDVVVVWTEDEQTLAISSGERAAGEVRAAERT